MISRRGMTLALFALAPVLLVSIAFPSSASALRGESVQELVRTLDEKATDAETFGSRWALLRDALLHRRGGSPTAPFPTLARVLNLRSLFAQDESEACRRLDVFLRETARALAVARSVPAKSAAVSSPRGILRPRTRPSRILSSPAAKAQQGPADAEALRELMRAVDEKPTSKESFQARWEIMADFVKRLPARVRKDELFGYAELVRCKLAWYTDAEAASMALDEFVGQAAEWIRTVPSP